jgi:hypothetical protein
MSTFKEPFVEFTTYDLPEDVEIAYGNVATVIGKRTVQI